MVVGGVLWDEATLFGKLEYPFLRYNLFFWVYVLSFYEVARRSRAFRQALAALDEKCVDGSVVVIECAFSVNLTALTLEQVLSKRRKVVADMCEQLAARANASVVPLSFESLRRSDPAAVWRAIGLEPPPANAVRLARNCATRLHSA